jgi:hypothetical protein
MLDNHHMFFKSVILLDMFLWCHFNAKVIMGGFVKWLIWVLKNSNKFILGFDFNKGPLNLNNSCIKSNQFCKLLI